MTQGFVVDSSVGVAWAVSSQSSSETEQLLNEVASGTLFVVPVLWMFEIANSLLVLARRKRIRLEESARARRALSGLTPIVDEDGPRLAMNKIADLAEKHQLSVYDATYLELAIRRGLPLASRDRSLNKAAQLSGLRTLV